MGLLHRHTTTRAVWTFLRRTRERLLRFDREIPGAGPQVQGVVDAIAGVEADMLADDPELPLRRLSTPRPPPAADVSETHALAMRVHELEIEVRQREEQLAMMAHDLRGPLSPLMLGVGGLANVATSPALAARISTIQHRLRCFVDQLNALLDATRMQTGDVALAPERVDLVAVARAAIDQLHADGPAPRLTGAEALVGRWDRPRIEQIVRNLVANALDAGGTEPVEVCVSARGDLAAITVRDHGVGIDPADHARIFDKHVILRGHGFGLGLWIVQQLVHAMAGSITVESAAGQGATFEVILPIAP